MKRLKDTMGALFMNLGFFLSIGFIWGWVIYFVIHLDLKSGFLEFVIFSIILFFSIPRLFKISLKMPSFTKNDFVFIFSNLGSFLTGNIGVVLVFIVFS